MTATAVTVESQKANEARLRVPTALRLAVTLFAVSGAIVAAHGSWALPAFIVCGAVLARIAVIDIETLKIPNRILGPAYLAAIPLLTAAAIADGSWDRLAWGVVSATAIFVLFYALWALSPRSLGMGDVKLAPYIALHLAWITPVAVVVGLLIGAAAAAAAGVLVVTYSKQTWRFALPYAPFLVFGAIVAMLLFDGRA